MTREWEKDTTQFSVQFNSSLSIHLMCGIFIITLDRLVKNNNKKHNVYSPVMKLITSIKLSINFIYNEKKMRW